MADRDRRVDPGFTLIEVVVVSVLVGLIALVIGFAITTVLRVTPVADSQVSTARSVQGLTVWFPADVASAVASGANITTTPSSLTCAGSEAATGVNLIELEWTVAELATSTFVAAYRLEPGVDGDIVHRYECSDATGPFNDTSSQTLTGPLASGTGVATATPTFDQVTLQLEGLDGTPINVEATPRNTAGSLPPVTTSPPQTPPVPCQITFDLPSPGPVYPSYGPRARATSGPETDKLQFGVPFGMTITGDTCGTVTIEYDTGVEDKSRAVTWSGTFGIVTIPKGDATPDTAQWTADDHTIRVYNNCTAPCATPPLDTTILVVT